MVSNVVSLTFHAHWLLSSPAVPCLKINLTLLRNDLQQWGLHCVPHLYKERMSNNNLKLWLGVCLQTLPRLLTGTDSAVFQFTRHSLCMDPTENIVPLLMWVTWCHLFHCSVTVHLAPDCEGTLLPTAFVMLHDINALVMMMCLPSCSLAVAIFLAPLFHLSDIMLQYNNKLIFNLLFCSHFNCLQSSSSEMQQCWLKHI
jgi:hypothetical protein